MTRDELAQERWSQCNFAKQKEKKSLSENKSLEYEDYDNPDDSEEDEDEGDEEASEEMKFFESRVEASIVALYLVLFSRPATPRP